MVDAEERVGEREAGERGGVGHVSARREVGAVGDRLGERVEDQMDGLQAEGVGERGGEDRDVRFQGMRERVHACVRGQLRRHRQGQRRIDDRQFGHERVVDERELARPGGQDRRGGDLRSGARCRRHRDQPGAVLILREARDALAGVEERERELAQRQLGMLVEEPHGLRRVDHRAAADGDDQVRRQSVQPLGPGAHPRLKRLRLDVGDHVQRIAVQVAADLVDGPARLRLRVGDDHRGVRLQRAQPVERPGVEVGARRHPQPLRRRLPARDGLDVEQVAVVDVVGGRRPAPGPAAEREGRRHRGVDPAQRADRGRGVDEDPARADARREGLHDGLVARVDGRRVAQAAVLGDELAGGERVRQ